jgi:hypothetical protein
MTRTRNGRVRPWPKRSRTATPSYSAKATISSGERLVAYTTRAAMVDPGSAIDFVLGRRGCLRRRIGTDTDGHRGVEDHAGLLDNRPSDRAGLPLVQSSELNSFAVSGDGDSVTSGGESASDLWEFSCPRVFCSSFRSSDGSHRVDSITHDPPDRLRAGRARRSRHLPGSEVWISIRGRCVVSSRACARGGLSEFACGASDAVPTRVRREDGARAGRWHPSRRPCVLLPS